MTIPGCMVVVFLALFLPRAFAANVDDYSQFAQYSQVKISPSGEYVAVSAQIHDEQGVLVIRLADKQILSRFTLGPGGAIDDYWWVGPERIVVSSALQSGALEAPRRIGELIGVDADGKNRTYLAGYRAPIGRISTLSHSGVDVSDSVNIAVMVDPRPSDPQHAIVAFYRIGDSSELGRARAFSVDVYTGARSLVATAPIAGYTDFLADQNGKIRYALTDSEKDGDLTYARAQADGDWQLLNGGVNAGTRIAPIRFGDGDTVYLQSDEIDGRYCLLQQNLASGEKKALSCDAEADLTGVIPSFDGHEVIAAAYENGHPRFEYLETANPDRVLLEKIQNSFPGEIVVPTSTTTDGKQTILFVHSDRDPGRYFLFDRTTEHAKFLLARQPWADPAQMPERRPITYKARDGQTLHGFLTIPLGKDLKALPMIVLPHGGPFFTADAWTWNAEAAWLAANGYLVLQPNFRGSSGYGRAFVDAGRYRWHSVMIDDITDATRWAIDQGYADGKRIGIYGASYGGYAALMSVIREPGLYRGAADFAGITDLSRWREDSDVGQRSSGRTYIKNYLGAEEAGLAAASPLKQVEKLQTPLLLVHGKADARVPYAQLTALRKALDARHLPYEALVKDGEGHGFFKPENRSEFLTRLVAFFDQHLRPVESSAAQPAASAAAGH